MSKKGFDQKKVLLCILGILVFAIIILSVVIVIVKNNHPSGGGNSGNDESDVVIESNGYEMAGTSEPIGLEDDYYEEGEQTPDDSNRIDEWVSESASIREKVYDMSFSEAMSYLDGKMSEKTNPDDIFNIRAIKINVFMNAEMFSQALEEANKITNVSELSLWNQEEYYNTMHWIYDGLDDKEKADEYSDLWYKTYIRRTGGASGGYE